MIATIDAAGCDRSPGCPVARICPRGAVQRLTSGPTAGAYIVEAARCTGCGLCVRTCRANVVSMIDAKE